MSKVFSVSQEYLQNSPEITAGLVGQAQAAINRSATPERYQVAVSKDSSGNPVVLIQDVMPNAMFNESQTGTMAKMRNY